MKHTQVTSVQIQSMPGASLGDCLREAALLACQEWRNVFLIYEGYKYGVLVNDLIECVRPIPEKQE